MLPSFPSILPALAALTGLLASGCLQHETAKAPYLPPDLTTADPGAVARVLGPLPTGPDAEAGAEADLCDDPRGFDAFLFHAFAGSVWRVVADTADGLDPVLMIYGPRRADGVWGRAGWVDDDSGDGSDRAAVIRFVAPETGEYLVVVGSYLGARCGSYRVGAACRSGCDPPAGECPALQCPADLRCEFGRLLDGNGCPTCECDRPTECPCGPGFDCRDRRCVPSLVCPDEVALVCGVNGHEYRNDCEARRFGVEIASRGPCPECPPIRCDLDCGRLGRRVDESGCEVCACRTECEACPAFEEPVCGVDGRTWHNPCVAQACGEVRIAFAGPCPAACPANDACDERCVEYRRDRRGCPTCECVEPAPACDCPEVEDASLQVCGWDGVTYPSACHSACAGVRPVFDAACPAVLCEDAAGCPDGFRCRHTDVVCADGALCPGACVLRATACVAAAADGFDDAGAADACPGPQQCRDGACEVDCGCPRLLDPVCGADGTTYMNACLARCAGAGVRHGGRCCPAECPDSCRERDDGTLACAVAVAPECRCDPVNAPVCAVNADGERQSFRSACLAECARARVVCQVSCEEAAAVPDQCE